MGAQSSGWKPYQNARSRGCRTQQIAVLVRVTLSCEHFAKGHRFWADIESPFVLRQPKPTASSPPKRVVMCPTAIETPDTCNPTKFTEMDIHLRLGNQAVPEGRDGPLVAASRPLSPGPCGYMRPAIRALLPVIKRSPRVANHQLPKGCTPIASPK
jgi:hypothetical protein